MGKVTKKMLEEYRKTKADIPILQAELETMRQGEAGIGTSVIMDYKKGYTGRRVYPALTGLCTSGDRKPCRRNRRPVRRWSAVNQYGFINVVYADSAEQTLIAGLRASLRKKGLGWVRVENALKTSINDRINALCILIAQRRFFYIEGQCDSLVSAICTAVWNSKNKVKNEHLDDGTSDIDSMDSFEYTFERQISRLIKYG